MKDEHGKPRWQVLLGDMIKIDMQLTQVAPTVFHLTVPHLGASIGDIEAAEARLGHPIDAQHADLLQFANGWDDAFIDGTLLSTHDLNLGPLWAHAMQCIDVRYQDGPSADWPTREHLLPVYASPYSTDVMALCMDEPTSGGDHPVVWLAEGPMSKWPNLYQWWLTMLALQQRTLGEMAARSGL